jgi:hypothetical protein
VGGGNLELARGNVQRVGRTATVVNILSSVAEVRRVFR